MTAAEPRKKDVEAVSEVIQRIATGDFSAKVPLSNRGDAFDAVAMGINLLGEEIQAYRIEKEEHERDLTDMLEGLKKSKEESEKARKELKESEERFRRIAETSIDFIFQIDKKGRFIYCSPSVEKILGLKPEEIAGTNLQDYFMPSDFMKAFDRFKEVLSGRNVGLFDMILLNNRGAEVQLELSAVPIVEDEQITGLQGIARDITEYKKTEMELKEREELYSSLTQAVMDAIITIGDEGKITYWNEGAEKVFGYAADEAVGRVATKLVVPEQFRAKMDEEFEKFFETGESPLINTITEAAAQHKNGNEFPMELSLAPVRIKGRWHAVGVARDITERKRSEEELKKYTENLEREVKERTNEVIQSEKMSSLGQLVAGVAHEINNPMAYLKTNTEFLEDNLKDLEKICGEKGQPLFEEMRELIDSNMDGINRVTTITKTLRRFARPDDKGKVVSDVNEGLKDTLVIVHNRLKHRIEVHEEYGDIPRLACNVGQLNQVFMNLIMNSSQAMDEGDIWLKTWNDHENVYVQVRDNGKGIPEEKLREVFNPFYTTKAEGTGLGLSLSYRIVQAHGGDIIAESEIGEGTTMTVKIPVEVNE